MKYAAIFFVLIIFLITPVSAAAKDLIEIHLNDGTIVSGKLISYAHETYTINSTTLGILEINAADVKRIRSKYSAAAPSSSAVTQENVQALQKRMMDDEMIMGLITSMLNDPDFQAVMQDENLMRTIYSGDINALKANPKFRQLLNSPAFEQIKAQLEQSE